MLFPPRGHIQWSSPIFSCVLGRVARYASLESGRPSHTEVSRSPVGGVFRSILVNTTPRSRGLFPLWASPLARSRFAKSAARLDPVAAVSNLRWKPDELLSWRGGPGESSSTINRETTRRVCTCLGHTLCAPRRIQPRSFTCFAVQTPTAEVRPPDQDGHGLASPRCSCLDLGGGHAGHGDRLVASGLSGAVVESNPVAVGVGEGDGATEWEMTGLCTYARPDRRDGADNVSRRAG